MCTSTVETLLLWMGDSELSDEHMDAFNDCANLTEDQEFPIKLVADNQGRINHAFPRVFTGM